MSKQAFHAVIFVILAVFSASSLPDASAQGDFAADTMLMFVGEELYTISAASRREESLREAPAAVTVLGRKELKRYRTLAEALKSVPGFYIDHTGIKENIYLRGVADSFLVMIDGVPMANDSSTVDYPRGLDLSLDYIEKIEIVRGPGSALWGADAFSGVVNIITRKGKDVGRVAVAGTVGSFDTLGSNFMAGYKEGNIDALLFGSYVETDGFEPDHSGNSRNDDRYNELYGKLSIGDQLTFSGRLSSYKNYYTINAIDNHTAQNNTPFSFLQLAYVDRWWSTVDATLKLYTHYFENYTDDQGDILKVSAGPFIFYYPTEIELDQDEWRYGLDTKFDFDLSTQHACTLGFSVEYDDASSTDLDIGVQFPSADYYTNQELYHDFENYRTGLYFQDRLRVSDHLEITGGIRLDKHEEYRRKISPRVAVAWFPYNFLDIKLYYGTAYRTPDLLALSIDEDVDIEKIVSYEGEFTLRGGKGLVLQGGYFYHVLDNLLENITQGMGEQSRRESEQGTELTLKFAPLQNLSLYANHTFLFGERQRQDPRTITFTYDVDLPPHPGKLSISRVYHFAPDHVLNGGATYQWGRKYTINVEATYCDKRDIYEEFYGVNESSLDPYWTAAVNVFAERLLDGRLDASLRLRNIFNRRFRYRGTHELLEGPDRSAFFEVRWHF